MRRVLFCFLLLFYGSSCGDNYQLEYYPDGSIKAKRKTLNGVFHGEFFTYFPNGNLESKGEWVNGPDNGYMEKYFERGGLKQQAHYKDGELDGQVRVYYPNGKLQLFAKYDKGRKVGTYVIYKQDGSLNEIQLLDLNGELYYLCKYGEDNSKVDELVFPTFKLIHRGDSIELRVKSQIRLRGVATLRVGYKDKQRSIVGLIPPITLNDTTTVKAYLPNTVSIKDLRYLMDFTPSTQDTLMPFSFDKRVISNLNATPKDTVAL